LAVADAFHRDGFALLRGLLPPALVARARLAAAANFSACQGLIAARELPFGMHAAAGFAEIVQRNLGRFEVPFGLAESPAFQAPELVKNPRLIAVLDAILGDQRAGEGESKGKGELAADENDFVGERTGKHDAAGTGASAAAAVSGAGFAAGGTEKSRFGSWGGGGQEDTGGRDQWRLLGRSIVVALPGALEQQWHVDGAHVDLKVSIQPFNCGNHFVFFFD
jgi:hypothetical protein